MNWANECWRIAKRDVYPDLQGHGGTSAPIVLSPDYARKKSAIAAEQLERAGVRLASILNEAFKSVGYGVHSTDVLCASNAGIQRVFTINSSWHHSAGASRIARRPNRHG